MALSIAQTAALKHILKPGMVVASFGYPDVIAPLRLIEDILREKFEELVFREDSEEICRRHVIAKHRIPDAGSMFKLLECRLDVYDIVKDRGEEIICDLNRPFTPRETYDVVLDVGTVEHCFNIGQAIFNMASLVKKDGVIVHENPFNCGNHGFYGLNPTWYHDFYTTNGFDLIDCRLMTRDGRGAEVSNIKRFRFIQEEINVFAMAKRLEVKEFTYPTQTKYKRSIDGN